MSTVSKHRGNTADATMPVDREDLGAPSSASDLLDLFKNVSQILGETEGQDETLLAVLHQIATKTGWPVGHVYFVDKTADVLAPSNLWHLEDPIKLQAFREVTAQTTFARSAGMPGKVWDSGKPKWIANVKPGPKFPRAAAAHDIGLTSGFGFPLTANGIVLGVVEFFSTDLRKPDAGLMDCLAVIGGQLGRMVEQNRSNATIARQAKIVDQVEEIIAIADSTGVIFDCNESFQRTFGLSKDQAIGRRMRDFLARQHEPESKDGGVAEYLRQHGAWRGNLDFEVADKTVRTFDLNVALYVDPATKTEGRMLVGRDITEALRATDALRLSNAALNATDGAVLIVDWTQPATPIVFANPAAEGMFGYSIDELIGRDPADVLYSLEEDNNDTSKFLNTIRAGKSAETTTRSFRKDGSHFERQVIVSPIKDESGTTTHLVGVSKNVTEAKQKEALVERQAAVMETMTDAVLITDEGVVLDCNGAFVDMVGASKAGIIGANARTKYIIPSDDTIEPGDIIAAVEMEGTWSGEQYLRRANGDILSIESRVSAMRDEQGYRKSVVTVCRDITARRKMEDSLIQQEAILSNIKEAMLIQSTDGIILECNDAATEQYGYTKDELIGMNSRELLPPDFDAEPFFKIAIQGLSETGHWNGEIEIARKDGVRIDVEVSSTLLKDRQGNVIGWVELNRDITKRKALEKELKLSRAALEATDVSVVITDAQDDQRPIVYVNPAFETMMGYSREEAIGKPRANFIQVDPVQSGIMEKAAPSRNSQQHIASPAIRKDGQKITRSVSLSPIYDDNDMITNWLSISRDITQDKEREALLKRQAAVMQAMADAVIVSDETGIILDCNQAYAALVGLKKQKIIGMNAQVFTADEDFATSTAILKAVENTGHWTGEGRLKRSDGEILTVDARLTVVPGGDDGEKVVVTVARDVTTQRKMEDHLERQAATLKNIQEAMLVQNAEGIVIDCNDAVQGVYGYTRSEMIGMSSRDLAHPDFNVDSIFKNAIPEIMAKGHWSGELEIQRKDGTRRTIESSSTVLKDRSGAVTGWVELTRDITDRKQVENTRRLQALVMEQLDESVVVLDLKGDIIECNAKSLEIYGYAREELLGTNAVSMLAFGDESEKKAFREQAIEAAQNAGTIEFSTGILRKDGSVVDSEIMYSVLRDEDGTEFARILVSKDVTATKQAQRDLEIGRRRLEAVIDASGAGIWEQDSAAGEAFIGPILKELSGYGDEFTNDIKQWRNLVSPEDLPIYDARYKEWDGRKRKVDAEYRIITKGGETKWVRSRGEIVGNKNQEMIWGIGLGWDVTEEKLKEQRQEDLEKQLLQSQKMETLGTLTGGIAHDFNNILTPILGYAHLAQSDSQGDEKLQKYLGRIVGGAERAKELIRRILTFSRHIEPQQAEVCIEDIANEVISLIGASAPPQIYVEVSCDTANTTAMADSIQIHQALMNLCTNALQAMGDTPGILSVDVNALDLTQDQCEMDGLHITPGRYITIGVQDSGGGIDPEIANRIFEPFFTTRAVDEGTGLGLSVVHGIAEAHGGAVTLDPNSDLGAKFQIYIPAHTKKEAAAA